MPPGIRGLLFTLMFLAGCRPDAVPRSPACAAGLTPAHPPNADQQSAGVLAQIAPQQPHYQNAALASYVQQVGRRVVGRGMHTDREFTFVVVDSEDIGANTPGDGVVYITRGALAALDSEAELAWVLAHEVGHNAAGHCLYREHTWNLGITDDFPTSDYEEYEQHQADRLALGYLKAAGYDLRESLHALAGVHAARAASQKTTEESKGGDDSLVRRRIARLVRHIAGASGGEVGRDTYLDRIDGMVFGKDPRNGVLRGSVYTCVRCGFAFDIPAELTPSLGGDDDHVASDVVRGKNGRGEEVVFFTQVRDSKLIQRGLIDMIRPAPVVRESIAGYPGTIGTAPDRKGVTSAAVLENGHDSYMFAASSEAMLRSVLSTLRRVSDGPGSLTPQTIQVRRVPTAGRFDQAVAGVCGTTHSVQEHARINGIDPGEQVEEGRRIKCIVP